MTRCKIQAQKCQRSEAELKERLIEQLVTGTRKRKVQDVLSGKGNKLKLNKAMDIARTREATINEMKCLEQQGASVLTRVTYIDDIRQTPSPQCGECRLSHGKRCPTQGTGCRKCNQWNHWEQVCKNKQTQDCRTKLSRRKQPEAWKPQDKTSQSNVHVAERQALNQKTALVLI